MPHQSSALHRNWSNHGKRRRKLNTRRHIRVIGMRTDCPVQETSNLTWVNIWRGARFQVAYRLCSGWSAGSCDSRHLNYGYSQGSKPEPGGSAAPSSFYRFELFSFRCRDHAQLPSHRSVNPLSIYPTIELFHLVLWAFSTSCEPLLKQ